MSMRHVWHLWVEVRARWQVDRLAVIAVGASILAAVLFALPPIDTSDGWQYVTWPFFFELFESDGCELGLTCLTSLDLGILIGGLSLSLGYQLSGIEPVRLWLYQGWFSEWGGRLPYIVALLVVCFIALLLRISSSAAPQRTTKNSASRRKSQAIVQKGSADLELPSLPRVFKSRKTAAGLLMGAFIAFGWPSVSGVQVSYTPNGSISSYTYAFFQEPLMIPMLVLSALGFIILYLANSEKGKR
jgi:hypothetical protein